MKKLCYEYGSRNKREVYLLPKEDIEKIVDELEVIDIYKKAYEKGRGYKFSGTAYVILDCSDGKIYTRWLQQNNFIVNDFTDIVVFGMDTPICEFDDDDLIDNYGSEMEEWENFDGSAEEFIVEKYGEEELENRKENVVDYWATEYGLEWNDIQERIDEMYENVIKDDESFIIQDY